MQGKTYLSGIGVSHGFAQGKILCYNPDEIVVPMDEAIDIASEIAHFYGCVERLRAKISERKAQADADSQDLLSEILDAHLEILDDTDSLLAPIAEAIREDHQNAAKAVQGVFDQTIAAFLKLENEYLRERAADMQDLRDQLLRELLGLGTASLAELSSPVVLVAKDLAPSETINLSGEMILAIICEGGGRTSHTAVLANELGIPAVMGCRGALQAAAVAHFAQVDGYQGEAVFDPDETAIAAFAERLSNCGGEDDCERFRTAKTMLADGTKKLLFANVASPEECLLACKNGCEGVGLFRSEFLFYRHGDALPSEEEQYQAFSQALRNMGGKPLIIRTFDAGGDKPIPALGFPKEENPFLGCRAIRICLKDRALFKTQLRALWRAGCAGELRVMFPMVASVPELRAAKAIFQEAREELVKEGIPVAEQIKLGIMIEVPSAVIMAEELAREVDFFSIGTNDLTQYVLAADRGNEGVSELYSHYDPSVVRMIAHTIRCAHQAGIPCGMCGEAAGDDDYTALLTGLGLDEFSVSSRRIPVLRARLSHLDTEHCHTLAEAALRCSSREELQTLLKNETQIVEKGTLEC